MRLADILAAVTHYGHDELQKAGGALLERAVLILFLADEPVDGDGHVPAVGDVGQSQELARPLVVLVGVEVQLSGEEVESQD